MPLLGKAMGATVDPAAMAAPAGASGASAGSSDGSSGGDLPAAAQAQIAAITAACKQAPDVCSAYDTAQVVTCTFAPDGSITVDVDGTNTSVASDDVAGGASATSGASAGASAAGAPAVTMPGAPPPQF